MRRKILYMIVCVLAVCIAGCANFPGNNVLSETGPALSGPPSYQVFLPKGYEESGRFYPTVYILPEDGIHAETEESVKDYLSAMDTDSVMDMIIVCPDLPDPTSDKSANAHESLRALVEEVDKSYRTIQDPWGRAAAGAGCGGFLASMLTFTDENGELLYEPGLFGLSGSISGDYVSQDNPWLDRYESLLSVSNQRKMSNPFLSQFYTFMTAASEDPLSYIAGGVNDVISFLILKGTAYAGMYYDYYGNGDETMLSLTVKNGEDDGAYRKDAVQRMLTGFTGRMFSSLIDGKLMLSPQAADKNVSEIEAVYEVTLSQEALEYAKDKEIELIPYLEITDPSDGSVLSEASGKEIGVSAGTIDNRPDPVGISNIVNGQSAVVTLYAGLLGARVKLCDEPLVRIQSAEDIKEGRFIDLMGKWRFKAVKDIEPGRLPKASEYEAWEDVLPALEWWDSDFSGETDMKAYTGYAWYVKEFEVPEDFPRETVYFPVGCFDETDIVFVNGKPVGSTGMDTDTWQPFKDFWDTKRVYMVSGELLNYGGVNSVIILTHNISGDGGWYTGHPGLYTEAAYAALDPDAQEEEEKEQEGRFFKMEIDSAFRALALNEKEKTVPESFLVYLPAGYFDPENKGKRYPTAYLFHQLNSTANSYRIDGIDRLVTGAILSGKLPELIMIAPDSNEDGFWMGDWEKMVTEEILPYVDSRYRTIADPGHRFCAGASMGGCGAYSIGLSHPELFSGIISYFGAINMGANPLLKARRMDKEELSRFRQFFIAGNRDLYKFGIPAVDLDRNLREKDIPHYFELGEGGHDSAFYLPYVIDSFAFVMKDMAD
ncbi:MAG: hypothetical protein K5770_08785 [Lachnospiraceae bacterium]|nr:hypothetical protein [Lachnospiraceae bacterium]